MTETDRTASRFAVATLCYAGLTVSLTQTMVIPLQAELPALLHTSASNASWVVTVTLLSSAISTAVLGKLGDLRGKRKVLLGCAIALILGSALCAISNLLAVVLIGRALQGVSIGLIPVGMSLIRDLVPPHRAATAIAAMSGTLGAGAAIGLPLAAWLVYVSNWHVLFLVSTCVGLTIFAAIWLLVPPVPSTSDARLDIVGAALLTAALLGVLLAVSKGSTWGWSGRWTITSASIGIAALATWAWWERRHPQPLIDLRLASSRPVLVTNAVAIALGMGLIAQSITLPQILQAPLDSGYGLGQNISQTGLWMAPTGLVVMAMSPVAGAAIRRRGARSALALGTTVITLAYLAGLLLMNAPWQLMILSCLVASGVSFGYAAMPTLVMDAAPTTASGSMASLNTLCRSIGTASGSAIMGSVLAANRMSIPAGSVPTQHAFVTCFVIAAGCTAIAAAMTLFIPARHDDIAPAASPTAKPALAEPS